MLTATLAVLKVARLSPLWRILMSCYSIISIQFQSGYCLKGVRTARKSKGERRTFNTPITFRSILPLRSESFLKRSRFLKNPIYLQITIYFVTSISQSYTFSFVSATGMYANLIIPFAIFRLIAKIFGHTIAKIQLKMRNTLKKK